MQMPTEQARGYFYRIALALLALLVAYGVITGDDIPVFVEVIGALLAVGAPALATANTSTSGDGDR